MSIQAMNWAFEQTGLTPEAKLVLICLADGCGATGRVCVAYPSLLASRCCMSLGEMTEWLVKLERAGLIRSIHCDDDQLIVELFSDLFRKGGA